MADPVRYARMTTAELRETFLLEDLFTPGPARPRLRRPRPHRHRLRRPHHRAAHARNPARAPLRVLPRAPRARRLQRRRRRHRHRRRHSLRARQDGRASTSAAAAKSVTFASADAATPAAFYLLSYLAHADYPTAHGQVRRPQGPQARLRSKPATSAPSTRPSHAKASRAASSSWASRCSNPAATGTPCRSHTHMRRSEVYFYFDVDPAHRVIHLMGPPDATNHLVMEDKRRRRLAGLVHPLRRRHQKLRLRLGHGRRNRTTTTWIPSPSRTALRNGRHYSLGRRLGIRATNPGL